MVKIARANRDAVKAPAPDRSGWCYGCDAQLVRDGQRCPNCGAFCGVNRFKPNKRNSVMIEKVSEGMEFEEEGA